jgi:hypothetical protein
MIQIPMTPDQYAKARAALATNSEILSHTESGLNNGSFATAQIEMAYYYATPAAELQLSIKARHGLEARLASEDQIRARLIVLLAQVV